MSNKKIWQVPLVVLALTLSACQSASPTRAEVTPLDHLPALRGDYFEFESEAVGRAFHIYVRLPENYSADNEYPVVYLLDGDSLFPMLAPTHLLLTYDEGLPEAILVGIAYGSFSPDVNKRDYDFAAPAGGQEEGGAAAFHEFLRDELIPEVEHRYQADPAKRVLVGQSRGGYFTLYSAFQEPDLFWGRIASNPTFMPYSEQFYAPPESAERDDLNLVVTSGSRDRPALRQAALEWRREWQAREDAPWAVHFETIEGGTHAADAARSYRAGLLHLFDISGVRNSDEAY
jgi:predicted alpha/beta superfamily hydrolase